MEFVGEIEIARSFEFEKRTGDSRLKNFLEE
jgi:hypothetical protein